MWTDKTKRGATRVEVLLVAAMLATVSLVVLPGLTETAERVKRARCLTNLRVLAAAAQAYASEDSRELIVPMHQSQASTLHAVGWGGSFQGMDGMAFLAGSIPVRFGIPYSFGGTTAVRPFNASMSPMTDPNGFWGARTKPLNRYIVGSPHDPTLEDLQSFACPADVGYPNHRYLRDVPRQVANIPCFELGGNSYRFPSSGLQWTAGGGGATGSFSNAVVGHARSALAQPGRLVLFADGMFDNLTRIISPETPLPTCWHGEEYSDQVAFADGSARMASARQVISGWTPATLQEMNLIDQNAWTLWLRRGSTWRIDAFPAPGVRIVMRQPDGTIVTPPLSGPQMSFWPLLNYTNLD